MYSHYDKLKNPSQRCRDFPPRENHFAYNQEAGRSFHRRDSSRDVTYDRDSRSEEKTIESRLRVRDSDKFSPKRSLCYHHELKYQKKMPLDVIPRRGLSSSRFFKSSYDKYCSETPSNFYSQRDFQYSERYSSRRPYPDSYERRSYRRSPRYHGFEDRYRESSANRYETYRTRPFSPNERDSRDKYFNDRIDYKGDKHFIPETPSVSKILNVKKKLLLVCDLNGVLIYRDKHIPHVRPYTYEFLDFVFEYFHVAVWSSAMRTNVDKMVSEAFRYHKEKILISWSRDQCNLGGNYNENCDTTKDIRKIWDKINGYSDMLGSFFGPSNTIVLDDSPAKIKFQPENQIIIKEYSSINMDDFELKKLVDYLKLFIEDFSNCSDSSSYDVRHYLASINFSKF